MEQKCSLWNSSTVSLPCGHWSQQLLAKQQPVSCMQLSSLVVPPASAPGHPALPEDPNNTFLCQEMSRATSPSRRRKSDSFFLPCGIVKAAMVVYWCPTAYHSSLSCLSGTAGEINGSEAIAGLKRLLTWRGLHLYYFVCFLVQTTQKIF